jgi:hypothetical protein
MAQASQGHIRGETVNQRCPGIKAVAMIEK